MNDEDSTETHEKTKDFDNSMMDGINSFANSSRNSSEDEVKIKRHFDLKQYLKGELDILLKVLLIFIFFIFSL